GETGERLGFGSAGKKETVDRFLAEPLSLARCRSAHAVCVDMSEPFRLSRHQQLPHAEIVHDKFHVRRRAGGHWMGPATRSFSSSGRTPPRLFVAGAGCCCDSGRIWTRWSGKRCTSSFALNRRLAKGYLLKEQLARLWSYTYEAAAHGSLTDWLLARRWPIASVPEPRQVAD